MAKPTAQMDSDGDVAAPASDPRTQLNLNLNHDRDDDRINNVAAGDANPVSRVDHSADPVAHSLRIPFEEIEILSKLREARSSLEILSRPAACNASGSGLCEVDPLCTERQKTMFWYYKTFGVIGLAKHLVQIAESETRQQHNSTSATEPLRKRRRTHQAEKTSHIHQSSDDEWEDEIGVSNATFDTQSANRLASSPTSRNSKSDQETKVAWPDAANSNANASWWLLLDDAYLNQCKVITYYLASLPSDIIEGLINGDLPFRMQDPNFRNKHLPYLRLRNRQGTYCVYFSFDQEHSNSTQDAQSKSIDVGKGLTLNELKTVCQSMRLYTDVDNPNSSHLAKLIDSVSSGAKSIRRSLDYDTQRRYGSSQLMDQFHHHLSWLTQIEEMYINWANDPAHANFLEDRLFRCFGYVGLSSDVLRRAPNHWTLVQSSPVIGLFGATLQYHFPDRFTVMGSTYQIFKTINRNHIGLDEKITTLLCSAYPWDGGLSTAFAANSLGDGPKDMSEQKTISLHQNERETEDSGLVKKNLSRSHELIAEAREIQQSLTTMPQRKIDVIATLDSAENKSLGAIKSATRTLHQVELLEDEHNSLLKQHGDRPVLDDAKITEYEDIMRDMNDFENT